MAFGIIYLAVNRVNGKAYVGQTKSGFSTRLGNHISVAQTKDSATPFRKALRKYGFDSFDFAVLEERIDFILDEREAYWISLLGCKSPGGYNRTDGGQGAAGVEYTPERREKLRQSQLGDRNRMKNPETVRKHALAISGPRNVFYGKFGPEHPCFGNRHSLSPETIAKQRAWSNRPEVREIRRQRMLARQAEMNSPEVREKRLESLRRYWSDPANKELRSLAARAGWVKRKGNL